MWMGDRWLAEMDSAAVKCNNVMAILSQAHKHTRTHTHMDTGTRCMFAFGLRYARNITKSCHVAPLQRYICRKLRFCWSVGFHPAIPSLHLAPTIPVIRSDLVGKHIGSMLVGNRLRVGYLDLRWGGRLHFICTAFLSHIWAHFVIALAHWLWEIARTKHSSNAESVLIPNPCVPHPMPIPIPVVLGPRSVS